MIRNLIACMLFTLAPLARSADDLAPAHTDITPESVAAVGRALEFLAAHQDPDSGAWISDVGYKLNQNYELTAVNKPHVGVTALAGLAFLSAGHLPSRGKYGAGLGRATDYLLGRVGEDGYISDNGSRMYSHAFATLFLAEVYGMTDRSDVRSKLQNAVDFIVDCQNELGSWRYEPFAAESDMSITVCQLNALRAARNVGIRVPRSTIDRAAEYVAQSYVSSAGNGGQWQSYYALERGSFRYQAQSFTRSSFALTAAGLAALHNAGINGLRFKSASVGEIDLNHSISFLRETYDRVSANSRSNYAFHYFYWYGHYYATQALYVIGGEAWREYYPMIQGEILDNQLSDGSFPTGTAGPGKNFSTAMGAIILSLPYGYLPIFQR
ncbi:MAG: hypothetical protein DHS20C15_10880 [Planctomycetota bacterium]|nr:MAG: hypothetical protein DHS20C15_10880 [Planctomycetota bacterium]